MTNPQRRKSDPITPETLALYRSWEVGAAAAVLCERYRTIIKTKTEMFVEMGLLLVEIERRELWKFDSPILDEPIFHSFNDWIKRASGTSNGTAHDALEAAKALQHIPVEERNEIPRVNQKVLAKLSPAVSGSPAIRDTAKNGTNDALLEKIEREHPGQHIEAHKPLRFSPERSGRQVIDAALQMCMEIEECGREEALEVICQLYVDENQVEYNKRRNSKTGVRAEVVQ